MESEIMYKSMYDSEKPFIMNIKFSLKYSMTKKNFMFRVVEMYFGLP